MLCGVEVGGIVQRHEMLAFPACLEEELHSLSFLHLLHTDLWVLVSMDWLCDFGLGAAPL